jgi:hypothetical protein
MYILRFQNLYNNIDNDTGVIQYRVNSVYQGCIYITEFLDVILPLIFWTEQNVTEMRYFLPQLERLGDICAFQIKSSTAKSL